MGENIFPMIEHMPIVSLNLLMRLMSTESISVGLNLRDLVDHFLQLYILTFFRRKTHLQ